MHFWFGLFHSRSLSFSFSFCVSLALCLPVSRSHHVHPWNAFQIQLRWCPCINCHIQTLLHFLQTSECGGKMLEAVKATHEKLIFVMAIFNVFIFEICYNCSFSRSKVNCIEKVLRCQISNGDGKPYTFFLHRIALKMNKIRFLPWRIFRLRNFIKMY